jgi:hypothetical protein
MPTTQASATLGCAHIACSMAPVGVSLVSWDEVWLTCAQTMGRNIDDVVRSRHHRQVAIPGDHSSVASVEPRSVEPAQVAGPESVVVFPQRRQRRRAQRDAKYDVSHRAAFALFAFVVDDFYIEARHGLSCRTWLHRKLFAPIGFAHGPAGFRKLRDARHGRAGLGRPPVVHNAGTGPRVAADGFPKLLDDVRLRPLARQEQRAERLQPVPIADFVEPFQRRVRLSDRPQRRRRREHDVHLEAFDRSPEDPGVRPDGLALKLYRRRAHEQRRVQYEAVADNL